MKTKKILSCLTALGMFAGCGKMHSPKKSHHDGVAAEEVMPGGENIQGLYMAQFVTLNPHINGTIPGSATFYRKDDRLYSYVRMFAAKPGSWHQQDVYEGGRCPTLSDDSNQDGIIDIIEATKVLGHKLIPLDADLSSQTSGKNFYPKSDLSGSYYYERVTSFRRFFNDLKSEDKNPDDDLAKVAPDSGLGFEGKVVMVLGVDDKTELPETVAGKGRFKAWQTLPIACGIFQKITATPGTHYDGTIPGPVAPVEPGQDHPAPDTPDTPDTGDGPTPPTTGGSHDGSATTGASHPDDSTSTTGHSHESTTTTGGTSGSSSTTGGATTGGATTGGATTGGATTGGGTTGGTTGGSSSTGTTTTGGSTTGASTTTGESGHTTTTTTGGNSTTGSTGSNSTTPGDTDTSSPDGESSGHHT